MWSLEHFNHYNHVVLQTDHKPLVSIWMKPVHTASPRIQRLLLQMSRYNVKLEYIQGKTNVIADALSRMTLNNNNSSTPHYATISIDEVLCSNAQISTTGIEKIRQETSKDVTLQHLKRIITSQIASLWRSIGGSHRWATGDLSAGSLAVRLWLPPKDF